MGQNLNSIINLAKGGGDESILHENIKINKRKY